jgi:hypothetical protein
MVFWIRWIEIEAETCSVNIASPVTRRLGKREERRSGNQPTFTIQLGQI